MDDLELVSDNEAESDELTSVRQELEERLVNVREQLVLKRHQRDDLNTDIRGLVHAEDVLGRTLAAFARATRNGGD